MNSSFAAVQKGYAPQQVVELMARKPYRHIPVTDLAGRVIDLLLTDEIHMILQSSSTLFQPAVLAEGQRILTAGKRILVTGGAGYIGSVLVRQLLRQGYVVKVLDKLIFGKASLQNIENNPAFTFQEGDTSYLDTVISAVKDVDAVVHLAEIVGDPACTLDPQKTQQMNYLSTVLIANVCRHFQVNRFIYASSCSVYGASDDGILLTEKSPLSPVSLYARMKMESERMLLNMADGFFCPTILRLATVFGLSPRMRFDLVVNTLTMKAIRENMITIFGGEQWRPHVHVSDVARSIITVLQAPLTQVSGEIFNVGSKENNFTINQLGTLVKDLVPAALLVQEEGQGDFRNYRVDCSKISSSLGFQTQVSVPQGIQETAAALRAGHYHDAADPIYYNDRWYGRQQ
jgi:nucleoside-diphosphate-sugar epimerase